MKNNALEELQKIFGGRVRENEPMSAHTTFKIGGSAQFYLDVSSVEDFIKAVQTARKLFLPVFVLGGGSNVIVSDKGIKGLVIKNNCRRFEVLGMTGRVKNQKIDINKAIVYAESGVIMSQLVRFTIEEGLGGLEYQLGLPGTVGGAIFMNSNFPKKGAFVGDALKGAKIIDKEGEVREVDKEYFRFAYDKSSLQETGEIVVSATFMLSPEDKQVLWERGMEALTYRNETQPKGLSAGCTFRNISIADAITVPTPERITSAGYLIDKAGLKGKKIGNAMISDKHANFIINTGEAKADDVVGLVEMIKNEVFQKFGVHLSLEVRTVGF